MPGGQRNIHPVAQIGYNVRKTEAAMTETPILEVFHDYT